MLLGHNRRLFLGSCCCLGTMSNKDLSDQPCTVVSYCKERQRWAVKLWHPRFHGKHVLVTEAKLIFDSYVAERERFPQIPDRLVVSAGGEYGNVLCCSADMDDGDIVFEESPFMVATNSGQLFNSRWNLYYRTLQDQGPEAPAIAAFNELADGGVVDDYIPYANNLLKDIISNSGDKDTFDEAPQAKALLDKESKRIAAVFARWQTNGHELRPRGCGDPEGQSALYRFASKMNHSCEPNCRRTVSEDTGKITARACRSIQKGEPLTIDYTGGDPDFQVLPVEARREWLCQRGFVCKCSRCIVENGEGVRATILQAEASRMLGEGKSFDEEVKDSVLESRG